MKPTYEELERQLEESRREFRAADATIHNLEQKLTDLSVQLANAESKCRELASEVSELNECKNLLEKIKSTSCHVDTSKDAVIPNSLDAWGRPVPQYLPYDFSGNPCASATQYCNGWNDAGGYWLNHVKYLQECIRAAGIGVKGE
ncbi:MULTISPECIES: hypothetical protein [Citrobacter freundii complex]|uniref:hypothetical protein n=1 Tax=Citrobacter freundii complex TaxID=1344959 RepID=UPI0006BD81F1|nr:hypothetical protein [Citrobacter portucalensis]ALD76045.1 hypothetical protein P10159_1228 [Citrobacter portucalensis]MBD9984573.1 hypothetical protein [Citrobacter portucalensis]MBE0031849.1 hypothetical protein [Citrobacter portucalensis]MBE0039870.1 hypothetical protein [Citrobacter portucalensis]MBE0046824.1 hypothetical protein [Citrobacter portucalensis]